MQTGVIQLSTSVCEVSRAVHTRADADVPKKCCASPHQSHPFFVLPLTCLS